ncbi:hypothetical protein C8R45DRAFT_927094 [Mycena sanguinolenta]|nr:hypothetical protein C8R45DRAFT_927094 [Mycena sanguinolenta]
MSERTNWEIKRRVRQQKYLEITSTQTSGCTVCVHRILTQWRRQKERKKETKERKHGKKESKHINKENKQVEEVRKYKGLEWKEDCQVRRRDCPPSSERQKTSISVAFPGVPGIASRTPRGTFGLYSTQMVVVRRQTDKKRGRHSAHIIEADSESYWGRKRARAGLQLPPGDAMCARTNQAKIARARTGDSIANFCWADGETRGNVALPLLFNSNGRPLDLPAFTVRQGVLPEQLCYLMDQRNLRGVSADESGTIRHGYLLRDQDIQIRTSKFPLDQRCDCSAGYFSFSGCTFKLQEMCQISMCCGHRIGGRNLTHGRCIHLPELAQFSSADGPREQGASSASPSKQSITIQTGYHHPNRASPSSRQPMYPASAAGEQRELSKDTDFERRARCDWVGVGCSRVSALKGYGGYKPVGT